ncbi:2Fe-2S iron-sulfur cluster-binding protein [Streptomyces sp. TG1A-8]|uniref:2Fe-2S iron-sulfur cluster-binding protein n=1 Tax=Streptomyces sp. TG1A-8 TaxID=3051385 RepID=UPI00265C3DD7|nr:2Fe-2S iron-sulfur cluster-binding protein [Streptomyces sp. TG1A-8]MDO0924349.1 2Fe-2S iron-sulfur cluster-binding protein [Streptomyces sp. TG1A-8]
MDTARPSGTTAGPRAGAPRTGWHRLTVTDVRRLTDDAVAVTLGVPGTLREVFPGRPGAHVVVRHRLGGAEVRRSYSVCPPPGDPAALRLVVKRGRPDGFGAWAATALAPGDTLELSAPVANFSLPDLPGGHHVLVAGGSGITPLAALAADALRTDPACRVSLVHAVPTAASALLADEMAELKDAFVDRFTALYVLTREDRESELFTGRVDGPKLLRLLTALDARPGPGTSFALCGPAGLTDTARRTLTAWGAEPSAVRTEVFTADGAPAPPVPVPADAAPDTKVTAVIAGRSSVVAVEPQDAVILDALLRVRPDVPYACRDGVCGSCRAKVVTGAVVLGSQQALDAGDLAAGYTLVCRARPRTGEVTVDFDV